MWYVCDVLYAVLNVRVGCFVVRGCARGGIYMFAIVICVVLCVLIVEGMSVVVNVMLSLSARTLVKLYNLGVFVLWVILVS